MPNIDIEKVFSHHPPHGDQVERYARLREAVKAYAAVIAELTPPSREQSLALTHLQTASMFAISAIAINEEEAP